jgi:hypothetical protein
MLLDKENNQVTPKVTPIFESEPNEPRKFDKEKVDSVLKNLNFKGD